MDFCLKEVCMHRKTAPGKTEAADMSMLRGRGLCCCLVGTGITPRTPLRSVRAAFPHTAPYKANTSVQ